MSAIKAKTVALACITSSSRAKVAPDDVLLCTHTSLTLSPFS